MNLCKRQLGVCLAAAVLLLGVAGTSTAEVYSGRELLRACTEPADDDERRSCTRWIDWGYSSPHFCIPPAVSDAALNAMLVAWLEHHPGKLHMPGGALVQNAFYDAYPCKRTSK